MNYAFELKMNRHLQDLNPIIAGYANCPPGDIGLDEPSPCTVIHYVTAGCGTFYRNGVAYPIHAGQAFIAPTYEAVKCIADLSDPWSYQWVGFTGSLSSHFRNIPTAFTTEEPIFPHLKNLRNPSPNIEIELAIDLMCLYAKLIVPKSKKEVSPNYVQAVIDYIQDHYMEPLTIQQIADHIGLNRDYLYRIYKESTGSSIQTHLQEIRMLEAKRLLDLGHTVESTSKLCGYNSLAHFSRQFKRLYEMSPQQWKKEIDQRKKTLQLL